MTAPPFFIVGFQRSGTTLLRLMLDNHPDIAIPLDTVGLWARYEDRLADYGGLADEAEVGRMVRDILADERIRLWQVPLAADHILALRRYPGLPGLMDAFHLAYAEARGKRQWSDKDPGNMHRIDRLHRWFPTCRIVHIIRDGRDACLSHRGQSFGVQDLTECADLWREQVEWVRRMGVLLGASRYHELQYEDLVARPEEVLRGVAAFLGLPWAPEMLTYHERVDRSVPEEKRHLWPLLNQRPVADNAGRWREGMTAGERICFERRAGRMLAKLGYETLPSPLPRAPFTELRLLGRRYWRALRARAGA